MVACGSLGEHKSGVDACNGSGAVSMEEYVEFLLERTQAICLASQKTEVQRRKQVFPTRLAEELWGMVLERRFEALE